MVLSFVNVLWFLLFTASGFYVCRRTIAGLCKLKVGYHFKWRFLLFNAVDNVVGSAIMVGLDSAKVGFLQFSMSLAYSGHWSFEKWRTCVCKLNGGENCVLPGFATGLGCWREGATAAG